MAAVIDRTGLTGNWDSADVHPNESALAPGAPPVDPTLPLPPRFRSS